MADNRFYLYCPVCKSVFFIGKCVGDENIYLPVDEDTIEGQLEKLKWIREMYAWLSYHFAECYEHDRFYKGLVFEIRTEFDDKVEEAFKKQEEKINNALANDLLNSEKDKKKKVIEDYVESMKKMFDKEKACEEEYYSLDEKINNALKNYSK